MIARAAVDALVRGAQGEALVQLAGMEGHSWSELEPVIAQVYPGERGAARPNGNLAISLLGDAVLRDVVEGIAPRAAARWLYGLWTMARGDDDRLRELGWFDERYALVDSGVFQETASDVDAELRAEAARILSAGGLVAA